MNALMLFPIFFSALLMGAHFLYIDILPLVFISLAFPFFIFLRKSWANRLVQAILVLGSVEWLRAMAFHVAERRAEGEPWIRVVFILGGVAIFTASSALVFLLKRFKERYSAAKTSAIKKNNKFLIIFLALPTVAAILCWYFFYALMGTVYYQSSSAELQSYLNASPAHVEKLPEPPSEWDQVSVDRLKFKLPLSKYEKIDGIDSYLNFVSDQGSLLIYNLVPPPELLQKIKGKNPTALPYDEELAIYKTLASDVSFLSLRSKAKRDALNLVQKAIQKPEGVFKESLAVEAKNIKAICVLFEKPEQGFKAKAHLYSPNENISLTLLLMNYENLTALKSDLLNFLASLNLPDQQLDPAAVKKDIAAFVDRYKEIKSVH